MRPLGRLFQFSKVLTWGKLRGFLKNKVECGLGIKPTFICMTEQRQFISLSGLQSLFEGFYPVGIDQVIKILITILIDFRR